VFNIGGSELLVILFVALIFLGPERLPTAARQVGKTIATLRGMAQGFQREFEDAIGTAEDAAREEEARARGAALVAASSPDATDDASGAAGTSGGAATKNEADDADEGSEATDAAVGFDASVEPDRTEKPLSSDGPKFHSAAPGVGPTIARSTPSTAASASGINEATADAVAAGTNGETADARERASVDDVISSES